MTSSFGATNVVVAVRARPFTPQEEEKGEDGSVLTLSMDQKNKTTTLIDLAAGTRKKFTFDYNYWSVDDHDSHFASQEMVFHDLAESQLVHAMKGYNACIFAYGQTSSGKTYTMMGPPATADHSTVNAHTGLIPRLCRNLFERITSDTNELHSFRVEMSFYEIYNEKVYCLLDPSTNGTLRPREDPKAGPYVENLTSVEVTSYRQIAKCLKMGNRERHTSKTRMNDRSSRSHAVFCLTISKSEWQRGDNGGDAVEFISRVNLVDLAGSERVSKAGSTGDVLKEGININKSLTSLGMVIKKLADLNDPSVAADGTYVPYRDSTLTWLLKDNLGGNSKTVMFATLSPCRYNIEETHTTLRYAERVKMIKNVPSINKRGSSRKMIRELRHQVRGLHEQLAAFTGGGAPPGAVLRNLLSSSTFYARILSSVMPVSIWAGHPFLVRSQPQNGEPFVWFIKEGYTIVTGGFDSYESIRQTEQSTAWIEALAASQARDIDDRIVAKPRVSTVITEKIKGSERRPSFMQATFASAFKDTGEVGEHLRAQQTAVPVGEGIAYLSKDPAHQLLGTTSGQSLVSVGSEKQLRRTESQKSEGRGRSNSGASNGSYRRRSLSGLRRRDSKMDKPGAREQHEVDNVAVPEVESEEDDKEHPEGFPKAMKSSFMTKRGRSSSVLGVQIGGTVERTSSNSSTYDSPHSAKKAATPHQVEQNLLSKIWERHRTTQASVRFPSRKSDPSDTDDDVDPSKVTLGIDTEWGLRLVSSTIRLPGLPDIDESSTGVESDATDAAPYPRPYAMFFHRREADSSSYAAPLLLPIGPTYLNGKLLPPQIPVEIPAKCSLKFGLHPTFTFLNPLPTTDHDGTVTTATNLTWNMGSVRGERSPGYSPDSPRSPERVSGGDSRAGHRGGEGAVDGAADGVGVGVGGGVGGGGGGEATAGYRDCTPPRATGSPDTDAYASQKATEPLLGRGDTASMERELRGLGFAGDELATAFVDAKQYATLTEREQRAMLVKRDRDLDEKSRHIAILYERLDDAAKRAAADRDESASPEQPQTGAAARRAAEAAAAAARAADDEDAATGDGDSDNEALPQDPATLQARLQTLKSQLLLQKKTSERLVIENASLKSALRGSPERSPARADNTQPFSQPNFLASRSQKTSLSSGSPRSSGLVSGEHLWQHTSGDIAASLGNNVAERRASSPVNEVHLDLERDEEREEERGKLARRLKEITLLFEDVCFLRRSCGLFCTTLFPHMLSPHRVTSVARNLSKRLRRWTTRQGPNGMPFLCAAHRLTPPMYHHCAQGGALAEACLGGVPGTAPLDQVRGERKVQAAGCPEGADRSMPSAQTKREHPIPPHHAHRTRSTQRGSCRKATTSVSRTWNARRGTNTARSASCRWRSRTCSRRCSSCVWRRSVCTRRWPSTAA